MSNSTEEEKLRAHKFLQRRGYKETTAYYKVHPKFKLQNLLPACVSLPVLRDNKKHKPMNVQLILQLMEHKVLSLWHFEWR